MSVQHSRDLILILLSKVMIQTFPPGSRRDSPLPSNQGDGTGEKPVKQLTSNSSSDRSLRSVGARFPKDPGTAFRPGPASPGFGPDMADVSSRCGGIINNCGDNLPL